jgi:hypothetical protein
LKKKRPAPKAAVEPSLWDNRLTVVHIFDSTSTNTLEDEDDDDYEDDYEIGHE